MASMCTAIAVRPPTTATTPTVEAGASWFATRNDYAAAPRFAWTGVRLDRSSTCPARTIFTRSSVTSVQCRGLVVSCASCRSLLLGMLIGAALAAIGAGEAREADNAARDAQPKPSEPHTLMPDVRELGLRLNNPDASNVDLNSPIKPYPMRMVRVRSTKAGASPVGEQR
jgi:hypothetical protein